MLRRRLYGGVISLMSKKLRKSVETIFCEKHYTAIQVANYFIVNICLPCVRSPNRLLVCEELLANISTLCQRYRGYEFIIAGDFNTDLDSSDPVAVCINKFLLTFHCYVVILFFLYVSPSLM